MNSSAYHAYEKTGNIDQSMVRLVMCYYDLDNHLEVNSSPCHYLCCLLPWEISVSIINCVTTNNNISLIDSTQSLLQILKDWIELDDPIESLSL